MTGKPIKPSCYFHSQRLVLCVCVVAVVIVCVSASGLALQESTRTHRNGSLLENHRIFEW